MPRSKRRREHLANYRFLARQGRRKLLPVVGRSRGNEKTGRWIATNDPLTRRDSGAAFSSAILRFGGGGIGKCSADQVRVSPCRLSEGHNVPPGMPADLADEFMKRLTEGSTLRKLTSGSKGLRRRW